LTCRRSSIWPMISRPHLTESHASFGREKNAVVLFSSPDSGAVRIAFLQH
jgi:hypothetical protein